MFNRIKAGFRNFLRDSQRIHIQEDNIKTYKDVVSLIDRSLADDQSYPLEWDDFVSWEHENPNIEHYRIKIAELEPLLVPGPEKNMKLGLEKLKEIRDEVEGKILD